MIRVYLGILLLYVLISIQLLASEDNTFTSGAEPTALYGVHEIKVNGSGNIIFSFTNNGQTTYVHGFHDGSGHTRARMYCNRIGMWTWYTSEGDHGSFEVLPSTLKGKLKTSGNLILRDNGEPFISIADTGYHLFNNDYTSFSEFKQYITNIVNKGATIVRIGVAGSLYFAECEGTPEVNLIDSLYSGSGFNYANYDRDDRRIKWALEHYPDLQIQLILFGHNDSTLYNKNRDALIQFMVDRYAAYPNIFFLIHNDAFYDNSSSGTKKKAIASHALMRLNYIDKFNTLRTTGFLRLNSDTRVHLMKKHWDLFIKEHSTYMHLETRGDLAADKMDTFRQHDANISILNMEDIYEGCEQVLDYNYFYANNEELFYRRGSWSWILSGGGFAYGGNWWSSLPYNDASPQLRGMDNLIHISSFFKDNNLEYQDCIFDDNIASNFHSGKDRAQAMKNDDSYVIYTPKPMDIAIPDLDMNIRYRFAWMSPVTGYYSVFQDVTSKIINYPSGSYGFDQDGVLLLKRIEVPMAADNLVASNISMNSAELLFSDNAVNEEGYRIYRDGILVATIESNTTKHKLTGLSNNTSYTYSIKAYNANGESIATTITFKTKKDPSDPDYKWLPAIYHNILY